MTLPVIGACLGVDDLPAHIDWLREKDRDLELQTFHTPEMIAGDWRPAAEQAVRLLDGHKGRRGIHGPFWGFTLDSKDPEVRAVVARRMDTALDIAEAVGADQIVIHSPVTTWDYNNFDNNDDALGQMCERVRQTMGDAVKRAGDAGVTFVLENIQDIDPAHRAAIAAHLGSGVVKLSVDTGHAHYAHSSTGAPPVDYFVKLAGNDLHHVHLQDADGHADRHWGLGEGTIRWYSVFRQLAALTSAPRLVLELRDKGRIPASMDFLEREGLGQ